MKCTSLVKLDISNFRNVYHRTIIPGKRFNIISGENGAGKTSLLEAIYFLSYGRSFRSTTLAHIIKREEKQFTLCGKVEHDDQIHTIGLSRGTHETAQSRLDGENLNNHGEIARHFPVIFFNPESIQIFSAGSKHRRTWLDWGVYQHDPSFLSTWQHASRLLKQRNAMLKQGPTLEALAPWDNMLVPLAEKIDHAREAYIARLLPILKDVVGAFMGDHDIEIQYYRGWPKGQTLKHALKMHHAGDVRSGHSHYGPHRADLRLKIDHHAVHDFLSRGQQKRLFCALKIAQGLCFFHDTGRHCVYLLDDISSELDDTHCNQLLLQLKKIPAQMFLTSIWAENLLKWLDDSEITEIPLEKAVSAQQEGVDCV